MDCPTCKYTETENVLIDLYICNRCSHVFKESCKVPIEIKLPLEVSDFRLCALAKYRAGGKLLNIGPINDIYKGMAENTFAWDFEQFNKDIAYKSNTFDAVSIFNYLEYINNPLECLISVESILKNDGIVIMEIPTLVFSELEVSPNSFYSGSRAQYFGQESILEMLKKSRLKIIEQFNYWNGTIANSIIFAAKEEYAEKYINKGLKSMFG